MSRNDLFFLLACIIAVATLSGSPVSTAHVPPVTTIASLLLPTDAPGTAADTSMLQHSFDHQ